MVRFMLGGIMIGPVVRSIRVPLGRVNTIVSPYAAAATASRSDPGPLSAALVTVRVAANTGNPDIETTIDSEERGVRAPFQAI
jgi:hypothetical protein